MNDTINIDDLKTYEEAAEMYKAGKKDEAIAHVKEALGEEAAENVKKAMEEADQLKEAVEATEAASAATEETQPEEDSSKEQ